MPRKHKSNLSQRSKRARAAKLKRLKESPKSALLRKQEQALKQAARREVARHALAAAGLPLLHREQICGPSRKTVYDERGIHVKAGIDLCDCLSDKCEGCFFPCVKCRSPKCGHECRQSRRWMYESHAIQGMDEVIQNQYLDH